MQKNREVVLELRVRMKPLPMYVNSASPEPMLSSVRVGFTFIEEPLPLHLTIVFKIRDAAFT